MSRGEPVPMILKFDKKALCCKISFKSGDIVYVFGYPSKRRINIGVPYLGTYSCHKIKGRPGCLAENQ